VFPPLWNQESLPHGTITLPDLQGSYLLPDIRLSLVDVCPKP